MLLAASRARAAANGRSYCAPDDVKAMAQSVLSHRIIATASGSEDGLDPDETTREIVQDILRSVPVTEAV
jgi:MoxR-like ATPase